MHLRRIAVVPLLVLAACSGGGDGAAPTTTVPATTVTGAPATTTTTTGAAVPTTAPATTTSTTSGAVPTTTVVPTSTSTVVPTTTAPPSSTTTVRTTDVRVYLTRAGRLVLAHRTVPAAAPLRAALVALLAGPTDAERAAGTTTAIPAGTTLRDVSLAAGLATVDLSGEFGSGGGSLSMQARVAEVVFTATQFATVDRVAFRVDGVPVTTLGGEGLVLTDPQTRASMPRDVTGFVLVDSPAPGATVARTFVVRGEGDVYEAQFPIEIRVGGRVVLTIAPVTAGAMGTWRQFTVTITVPATVPSGPIELVAYDAGGCGTDPECPPPVLTVVPLVLS